MNQSPEQIVRDFKKRWNPPLGHSDYELMALAYDEVVRQKEQAEARSVLAESSAARSDEQLDSMCRKVACSVVRHTDVTMSSPLPDQWVLTIGLRHAVTMTCEHPSKWDRQALEQVVQMLANQFATKLWAEANRDADDE